MTLITTTDNTPNKDIAQEENADLLQRVANTSLQDLANQYPELLVFPTRLNEHKDGLHENRLYTLHQQTLTTHNTVGFIGIQENGRQASLQIQSRFDKENTSQYFLQYMLGKVFCPTLLDFKTDVSKENIWDFFLALLFPYHLKKALAQGLFKQYRTNAYNDSNVKGKIDINRHLKRNQPFMGKIAYTCREFSFDNPITQLIRHTLHFLEAKQWIFDKSSAFNEAQQLIKTHTPTWKWQDKQRIITQNQKQLQHPYFYEYEPLRKMCLRILASDGVSLASKNTQEKVYGVLFDVAWIWEEYLAMLLTSQGFTHPKNKETKEAVYLFTNNTSPRYPDFYKGEECVCDAKYKRLENGMSTEDLNQMVMYLYLLKSQRGIFIYPTQNSEPCKQLIGKLNGYGGLVEKIGFPIPQNIEDFGSFVKFMQKTESNFSVL